MLFDSPAFPSTSLTTSGGRRGMPICRPNLRQSSISDQRTSPRRIFRQGSPFSLPPSLSHYIDFLPSESASSQEFEGRSRSTFNRQLRARQICNSGRPRGRVVQLLPNKVPASEYKSPILIHVLTTSLAEESLPRQAQILCGCTSAQT